MSEEVGVVYFWKGYEILIRLYLGFGKQPVLGPTRLLCGGPLVSTPKRTTSGFPLVSFMGGPHLMILGGEITNVVWVELRSRLTRDPRWAP